MAVQDVAAPNQYNKATDAGMKQLSSNIATTPNLVDIYKQALATYGVTDARPSIEAKRTQLDQQFQQLNAVEAGVNQKVEGTNTTEAQRQHLVAAGQSPMAGTIASIARSLDADLKNLGMDVTAAGTATGYSIKGNQEKRQQILDQIKLNMNLATDRVAREEWATTYNEKVREFAAQQNLEQQRFAEEVRHNKAAEGAAWQSARNAKANSVASSGSSGSGGGVTGGNGQPGYGFKNGKDASGGYFFVDANGKAISAGSYAKQAGVSLNSLVTAMANSGDKGAANALKHKGSTGSGFGSAFTWGS